MKVLLQEEVPSLGKVGDVVNVKAGYARNFLFPKSWAILADEMNINQLQAQKKRLVAKIQKLEQSAKTLATRIEEVSVTINKQVGEEDRIFGSVSTQELADLLKVEGIEISKKQISINEEVKKIGVYHANVKLPQGVDAKLKFWVVAK